MALQEISTGTEYRAQQTVKPVGKFTIQDLKVLALVAGEGNPYYTGTYSSDLGRYTRSWCVKLAAGSAFSHHEDRSGRELHDLFIAQTRPGNPVIDLNYAIAVFGKEEVQFVLPLEETGNTSVIKTIAVSRKGISYCVYDSKACEDRIVTVASEARALALLQDINP